ncbi:MAG: hypothetical protein SPL46_01980, partial [Selenomonadaceae bacterium]|nr:hypothetical protein [Selenomonadaceae bacterium]
DSLRRGAPFVNQLLYITSSVSACQELFEFIFASSQDVWDSAAGGFFARGCLPPTCNILQESLPLVNP